jgi:DegV family protein with EDD domain
VPHLIKVAKIRIITDSASDIPKHLRKELDIDVVSLSVRFGDKEYENTADMDLDEFWSNCKTTLPVTSAPSPGNFVEALERAKNASYDAALIITLSSELSGTYQSATNATELSREVLPAAVIDSRSVSIAEGLIAIASARANISDLDQLIEHTNKLIDKTRLLGVLDTLDHLKRGGRIGGAQALLGSLLSIKPVIEIRQGKVEPESKQRTRSKALDYLIDKVFSEPSIAAIAVLHANSPDIGQFEQKVRERYQKDVIKADIGPIIGAHTGPGAIGIAYQLN